jgi:hypothetical protein
MALAHTRLKRDKNSCSSFQSLQGLFEEGENLVWGLDDSFYSRDLGPLADTPIPLPFFEGVQPTLTVHTPDASSIQIMFTMCPFSPFMTRNKKKEGSCGRCSENRDFLVRDMTAKLICLIPTFP